MKAAEIMKFLAEIKKKDKQGVRRNGKNLLKNERSQKAGKRVKPFTAQRLVKDIEKRVRYEPRSRCLSRSCKTKGES